MLIRIERDPPQPGATLGVLLIQGQAVFVTREDPMRTDRVFIPGESCLPPDLYNLSAAPSRRFGVPGWVIVSARPKIERRQGSNRCGMFFHPGEPEVDLGGEILLGKRREGPTVRQTAEAYQEFSAIIRAALDRGEAIEVEIN